jgi:hypothetical protein
MTENLRQQLKDGPTAVDDGPSLADGLLFVYRRRVKLFLSFLLFFGLSVIIYAYRHFSQPQTVSGTVQLLFSGIEKREYPSGRKFSIEDFRGPDLLSRALADSGIPANKLDLKTLAAHFYVTAVIPADVQSRWALQERNGTKREEYVPNEFRLQIDLGGIPTDQRIRLFGAIVKAYQERVKGDQRLAHGFVSKGGSSYKDLSGVYDFWDVPSLFQERYEVLNRRLVSIIAETAQNQEPTYRIEFQEIVDMLRVWATTRLMALEALTYQSGLVKHRDLMVQRVQYKIGDVEIQVRQKTQEAAEAMRLLGLVERPSAVASGQIVREGTSVLDMALLDRLVKGDYVKPVVERITELQEEVQSLQAERERLERQLTWLPKSKDIDVKDLPPIHRELIDTVSVEFTAIADRYNRVLDNYLASVVTSKVIVGQSPILTRAGYSPVTAVTALAVFSLFLSFLYIAVEHLLRNLRSAN